MSSESQIVRDDDGSLKVVTPYRRSCEAYSLGFGVACSATAALFLALIQSVPSLRADHRLLYLPLFFATLGVVIGIGVKMWKPVAFYEWMEGTPGSDRGEDIQ